MRPSAVVSGAPRQRAFPLTGWLLFVLALLLPSRPVHGEGNPPNAQPPARQLTRRVTRQAYHWQLARWETGDAVCDLFLLHDQWPSYGDIRSSCGEAVLQSWLTTPACQAAETGGDTSACSGLLLRYLQKTSISYAETVTLPGIQFQVDTPACPPGVWCAQRPTLTLEAVEPLDGYRIEHLYLRLGGRERTYRSSSLHITLPLTEEQGAWVTYWAASSYGDVSLPERLRYRVLVSEDGQHFRLDLLTESQAENLPAGALLWQVFPPAEGLPEVLQPLTSPAQLYTEASYLYLAGYLIQSGQASAADCADGGLTSAGAASPCGAQAAAPQVIDWQNRFNAQILQAAQKYDVPPRLLKGLIAQESQFIGDSRQPYEMGLGHMTADGADMLLTWNTPYYLDLCQDLFQDEALCAGGYSALDAYRQTLLRKAVLDQVGTPAEIEMLAAALYASAAQVGQLVQNISRQPPSEVSAYVDLWQLATGNYYGGAGCLSAAMEAALKDSQPLLWDTTRAYLSPACQRVEEYVQRVWQSP